MKAPILKNNEHSVLSVESKTGIVLTTCFQYNLGDGEVFHIFQSYESALEFINDQLAKSSEYDFTIYNNKGKYLLTVDKNTIL